MLLFRNLRKILEGSLFLCGVSMATDYSQVGIKSMEDARNFKSSSRISTIPDEYIVSTIAKTITYFETLRRQDQAIAVIWKLDSLCGHTLTQLRTTANSEITRLVNVLNPLSETETRALDVRLASILWSSQHTTCGIAGTLKSPLDICVVEKIGQLLTKRTDDPAIKLKGIITEKLRTEGYGSDIDTYFS